MLKNVTQTISNTSELLVRKVSADPFKKTWALSSRVRTPNIRNDSEREENQARHKEQRESNMGRVSRPAQAKQTLKLQETRVDGGWPRAEGSQKGYF